MDGQRSSNSASPTFLVVLETVVTVNRIEVVDLVKKALVTAIPAFARLGRSPSSRR
jgi:hypothetical protein